MASMLKAINQGQYSLHYILKFQVAESEFFFWLAFTKNQLYCISNMLLFFMRRRKTLLFYIFLFKYKEYNQIKTLK